MSIMAWSASYILSFNSCKSKLVSSPLLLRCDSSKLVFLQTAWSTSDMGYILVQLNYSLESLTILNHLVETGDCGFELSLDGPRLSAILFGSRSNLSFEKRLSLFCWRNYLWSWSIARNRHYLWGKKLYWICDYNYIKKILEYTGSVNQLWHWSQERFGCDFSVVHRSIDVMKDVDVFSRNTKFLVH